VVFTLAGRGTGPEIAADDRAASSSASSTPPASTTAPAPSTSSAPASTPASTSPSASSTDPAQERPKVDVLNQSALGGSASAAAARLRERGWRVGRVDDFVGNVAETTVYYPPGFRRQARALAREFTGSPRVLPAFSTISGSRLTVILVAG
jgi:hypothetical protein